MLVAEPCDIYRRAIVSIIEGGHSGLMLSGEVADRSHVPRAIQITNPDVLVLCLHEMTRFDLIPQAINAVPGIRVVAISYRDDGETVAKAIRAGAMGFLSKRASPEEILFTLKEAARGKVVADPSLLTSDLLWAVAGVDNRRALIESLTDGERKVLDLLAQGMTARAMGVTLFLSKRTIEGRLVSIYRKLGVAGRIEAALLWAHTKEAS